MRIWPFDSLNEVRTVLALFRGGTPNIPFERGAELGEQAEEQLPVPGDSCMQC